MTEDEARAWLLANGWTVETASLYDEEGVEGWCWSHPDRMIDLCEIGDWSDPPPVPSELMRIAEDATKGDHAMTELLPCPFCGGKAEIFEIDEGENAGGSCVCCTRCMASGSVEFGFKENFVSNWNRRAPVWQPIATAPENETILVCQAQNSIICTARGRNKHGDWGTGVGPMDYIAAVTHWQPLPAPPEETTP